MSNRAKYLLKILISSQSTQQVKKITGKVVDTAGEPIIGASVSIRGTNSGAITNLDGAFSLSASIGSILVVSYIGYQTTEIRVGPTNSYTVTLKDDSKALEEVVVTAMGIKKEKKALGYSVSDINSKELLKNKQTNVINSLAGKIPGVNITQSGGAAGAGSSITIRGGNSASESRDNQPLFVVDGIIYDNSTVNSGNSLTDGVTKSATTFSNRVMDINPEDIESMSVLKGAAAAALYGSRAADGVVIITTKKGGEGVVRVNVSSKYTYGWAKGLPEIQGMYGRGYYNEKGVLSDFTTESWGNPIEGNVYDNISDFFQGSNIFDNSVSITGGSKSNSFYLSASNYDQTGIVPGTSFNKNTFRFNGEQKYGILTASANVSYSQARTDKAFTAGGLYTAGGSGAMSSLYGWSRSDDITHWLNDDDTRYRIFQGLQEPQADTENPYWVINRNQLQDATDRFTGALNLNVKLTDWWNLTGRAGIDQYTTSSYTYKSPGGAVIERYQKGYLAKSSTQYQYLTGNFMSNMEKKVGDFNLGLLAGATVEDTKRINQQHWGYNPYTNSVVSFAVIENSDKFFTESNTRKRMVGLYGEFRAAYKSIAYLTITGRNDWSSTLPIKNRSYFYPSVSGSFAFTELLPANNILTFGKIRASWAQVGKDADPYMLSTLMRPVASIYQDSGKFRSVGLQWTAGNPDLKPEIQTSYELGTELRFFNGRLGLDYTYYYSKTKDQICAPRLGQSTGYIFLNLNGGSVTNEGMELSITGKPIVTKDFQWEATLNLSGNRGKLGKFIDGVDIFYVTDAQQGGAKAGSIPNGGYFLGLTGNKYVEATGTDGYEYNATTGLIKDTQVQTNIVGNREPKMIGGLNNSFTYKNWNLSFLLDLRLGGDIYNGTEYMLTTKGMSMRTLDRDKVEFVAYSKNTSGVYEAKTYTYEKGKTYTINNAQKSGEYMIQQYWDQYANNAYNFITKTNWIRLRNLSLSYDFKDLLKKQNVIKGLTVNVTGNNLLLITNYKGMDPETASAGSGTGGSGSVGIDYCGVPAQASMSFGVNITF